MTEHGITQDEAVLGLTVELAGVVRMALLAEPVEGRTHVEFLACSRINECQIDRRTARMGRSRIDIALLKEHRLVHHGVENLLHRRVLHVLRPTDKMVDGSLRTVGIPNLKAVAIRLQFVADGFERVCRLACHERHRLLVAVDAFTHKIIRAVVADLQNRIGDDVCQIDKSTAVFLRLGSGLLFLAREQQNGRQCQE